GGRTEIVLERGLARARDDDDVRDAGAGGFLDDVMDHRPVDEREHLLRDGLARGKDARAESGGRDDGFGDGHGRHDAMSLPVATIQVAFPMWITIGGRYGYHSHALNRCAARGLHGDPSLDHER